MANILETASLTASGRPVLHPTEVECHLLSSVDVESEPESESESGNGRTSTHFPQLKSGVLILTTQRLIWIPNSTTSTPNFATSTSKFATSTPVAIPLSSIAHIFSSKKKSIINFHSPRVRFQVRNAAVVTVVARGKGTDFDGFVSKFWECWRGRAWDRDGGGHGSGNDGGGGGGGGGGGSGSGSSSGGGFYSSDGSVRMVGVSGILKKEQELWESTDKSLHDAFRDLNALMVMPLLCLDFVYVWKVREFSVL